MSNELFVVTLLAIVVAVYVVIAMRAYLRYRGTRVLTCPETGKPVAVTIDAGHAAATAVWEKPEMQVGTCSRWPERRDCSQACAVQAAEQPVETLAFQMARRWYAGKACGICRKPMPELAHTGPKPGFLNVLSPMRAPVTWDEIPAESLPAMFESHLPVCPNCQVAETFRHQFPHLAIDRKPHAGSGASVH